LALRKLLQEDNKWAKAKVTQFAKSPKTQEIAASMQGSNLASTSGSL